MPTADDPILDRIEAALESADPAARMATATQGVRPEDLAAALLRLDTSATIRALSSLDAERAAYTLIELPTERARAVINQLPDATVAHYLDILPMDDAVELREELDPRRFEALLRVIPDEDAQEIRRLLAYPEGSAGQIMTEDFVEVGPDATMNDVLAVIRETSPEDYETVNYIYVLDDARRLLGLLTLRRVIRAQPLATAREVMNPEPVTARVTDREEDLARTLAKYGFSAIPVLDDAGVMVGIVTADDAQEILEEAETEDVLALGAVTGDAEPYLSLGVVELMKRRVPWLVILFLAEFFTGTVLRHYVGAQAEASTDEALGTLAKLQLFIPLLIGAGGNAGSQVTTTITRALALGEIRGSDWLTVMRRELVVACLVGAILGSLGFLRAYLPVVGWDQPYALSLVIGFAIPAIVVWAAMVGSLLPIAAKRVGLDPAVLSAPFITTFVDATGLIIYFEIAFRVLGIQR